MLTIKFETAIKENHQMIIAPDSEKPIKGYFTDSRIYENTIPKGWYAYEIRLDKDKDGDYEFSALEKYVIAYYAGTFLTQEQIELGQKGFYDLIENGWKFLPCKQKYILPNVESGTFIKVYSTMNEWIDFCITLDPYADFIEAKEIIQKAYDNYWDNPDAECMTIADWISEKLFDANIDHDIYFADTSDSEEE